MMIKTPRASGITLIELVIVMALLSLAAALVGPAVGAGLDNMALRSMGRRLISVFRQVQANARTSQETLAVRVENGQIAVVSARGLPRILNLNPAIRVGSGEDVTYLFLGSGQIVGPEHLNLENRRGRIVTITLGPAPGTVELIEGEP